MDSQVTVSVRALLLVALAVLAIVVAYLVGEGSGPAPAAAQSTAEPAADRPRSLTLSGSGRTTVVPDQVAFDLRVTVIRDDLTEALDAASGRTADVLAVLKAQGVLGKDIETTGLEMEPQYSYPRDAEPILTGYRVVQSQEVLVRELKAAGPVVSAVVAAGGNDVAVDGIRLRVGDPEAALAEARADAVADATAKAEEYVAATGQDLGPVVSLAEAAVPTGQSERLSNAYAYDTSTLERNVVPIRAGTSDLSVRVSVVWELAGE